MDSIDRRAFLQATTGLLAALSMGRLPAQAVTDLKSLQIIVPTPPGSQPDLIARWLIEPMSKRAKLTGTVVNRPGAAGAIAADAVLSADPGSGPLLLSGLDAVAYSHLNSGRRALDPFIDFLPVGVVNRDTWVVVTTLAQHHTSSLSALVEWSRASGPVNYATSGEGSAAHLVSARLCKALGIDAQHVPYKESFLPDLMAGRIQFAVVATPGVIGQIKGGKLRAIATLTDERLGLLGDVPSIRELGWPDQVFYGGLFLFAPASLAAHATRINQWLVAAMREPDVALRYRDAAIEPTPQGLDEVRQSVAERLRLVDSMRLAVFGRTR